MKRQLALSLCPFLLLAGAAMGQDNASQIPDLTKGEKHLETHDWNLGPTGMRGYVPGSRLESLNTRQMLVSEVAAGSPAAGVIQPGDVIIGVDGKIFESDVRRCYGAAITRAETEAGGGRLNLLVWREGNTSSQLIKLPVLGAWSATSPVNCPKTEKIITNAAEYARKFLRSKVNRKGDPQLGGIDVKMAALGLLATGRPEHLEEVVACVRDACDPAKLKTVDINLEQGLCAWSWGYTNLFLTEYYLATGDKAALPAIERYANAIALGQSGVGTWGHRMAHPYWNYGQTHGRIHGYGALNQAGIVCHLSLVLAQKCGVRSDEIDLAVTKANAFFRFYAGKGSIPYGDHEPYLATHDVNGKNATAAIIYDLQGEDSATQFFAAMATACHRDKERGHTGNYFGFFWGALGARRIGIEAETAYLQELRWFFEMQRTWDGGFPYQGALGSKAQHKYGGWDSTGGHLLALTAPLGRLYINGRGTKDPNVVTSEVAESLIRDGAWFTGWGSPQLAELTEAELRAQLGSWSPVLREAAAKELGKLATAEVAPLVAMLDTGTREQKLGAAVALGKLGQRAAPAVPSLIKTFASDDPWLKGLAARSLPPIGPAASTAIPTLMQALVTPDPGDERQMLQRDLALALFKTDRRTGINGLLAEDLGPVDKKILRQAVAILLKNPDGATRSTTSGVFPLLTKEEIKPLMPTIVDGIINPAPSGVMFSHGVRENGLKLLAGYHIREGMELCLDPEAMKYSGVDDRRLNALALYGAAARPLLPQIRKLRQQRQDSIAPKQAKEAARGVKPKPDKHLVAFDRCIKAIESDQNPPAKLIPLADFLGAQSGTSE